MSGYKIVHLNYTEQASIVVKAATNEEAENAVWEEFPNIPDLRIEGIEDCPDELVEEVRKQREQRERVIN